MKLLPMMRKVVPFVNAKGEVESLPMTVHLSRGERGDDFTILRIGENTYWFDAKGNYDGSEHHLTVNEGDAQDEQRRIELNAVLEESRRSNGVPPEKPYFQPGSRGHAEETRAWPKNHPSFRDDGSKSYELEHVTFRETKPSGPKN